MSAAWQMFRWMVVAWLLVLVAKVAPADADFLDAMIEALHRGRRQVSILTARMGA